MDHSICSGIIEDMTNSSMINGLIMTLHKNEVFQLRISPVNVTKSAGHIRIWSHLLEKSLMENFIFCAV